MSDINVIQNLYGFKLKICKTYKKNSLIVWPYTNYVEIKSLFEEIRGILVIQVKKSIHRQEKEDIDPDKRRQIQLGHID